MSTFAVSPLSRCLDSAYASSKSRLRGLPGILGRGGLALLIQGEAHELEMKYNSCVVRVEANEINQWKNVLWS